MKPTLILVGADKGGVGKTTLSRALMDYFVRKNILTRAFDTENPRGTLKPGLQLKQWYDRPTVPEFDEDGCVSVSFNELGFRDQPFTVEKKPGEFLRQ